jgi:murein L,D-transpeptidase YcbB/YkuD
MKNIVYSLVISVALATSAQSAQSANTDASNQETQSQTAVQTPQPTLSPVQSSTFERLAKLSNSTKADRQRAQEITQWYKNRSYEPIWVVNGEPSAEAQEVIYSLMTAYEQGLLAADYRATSLFGKLSANSDAGIADFEVSLSLAAVTFGQHLYSGRVEPTKINREVKLFPDDISAELILDKLSASSSPKLALSALSPNTPRYDRMRALLLSLRLAEARGGWTVIPEGEVLKEGMEDVRIPALRERLEQTEDLPKGLHDGNVLDGNLLQALKYFQWRMGLQQDGAVGPATLTQLNTPVSKRIEQVELNLERRRWMQADFGATYIFVNLADQVLKLVKDEKTVHAAIVQVGQPYHRTPVFTEQMEYLDFNPFWNVPYSIATKEYLPKLKRNAYALSKQNIRVLRNGTSVDPGSVPWSNYSRANFPVRLRQDPGPKNALGRVKFMFPNKFNIYIHDTPSKSKFTKDSRYFSHGCIRLQNPFDLAEKILALQGISRDEINQIARVGKKKIVKLKKKIPVHVAYLTAWVNKDGSVHYRRDVYGRDKILKTALAKIE